jgi:hypothetical protein
VPVADRARLASAVRRVRRGWEPPNPPRSVLRRVDLIRADVVSWRHADVIDLGLAQALPGAVSKPTAWDVLTKCHLANVHRVDPLNAAADPLTSSDRRPCARNLDQQRV